MLKHLIEELISPSKDPNTMSFWHGGRLDDAYSDTISHKKGRWEFGPGLYLTTNYYTVQKYAKGSRKLYMITIEKGNNAGDVELPFDVVQQFIDRYVVGAKKKEIKFAVERYSEKQTVDAQVFINIIVNHNAIKNSDTFKLREFLVNNGVDYSIVDNAFGWGERMMVLFNMRKIVDKKVVTPKDKVDTYDLPTNWN
jgi:hypothetical protein